MQTSNIVDNNGTSAGHAAVIDGASPIQIVMNQETLAALKGRTVEEDLTVFAGKALIVTTALATISIIGAIIGKINGPAPAW